MKFFNKVTFLLVMLFLVCVFTTKLIAAQAKVNLLTTDGFAILGGSGISDTGTSVITGAVGLSPTGGASITGLTCLEVTGTIYDTNGGYVGGGGGSTACLETDPGGLTTAKSDLVTVYNDALGRVVTETVDTELGGTTLSDGVYNSDDGTFGITGTLTLDGEGNADSVFIFKASSTLITASDSRVVLINGAQPCNVHWQVGSSSTLGTTSTFVGNILALTSITDNGGSVVSGRLLARNGAVTLNNTTVTRQSCAVADSGSSSSNSTGTTSPPEQRCPAIVGGVIAPVIISSRRIDSESVFVSWGPYSGTDSFNVRYGTVNGNWLYNTDVLGFSTTIKSLPTNEPIWLQVAARNECQLGTYGEAKLVGGPRLPNAGFNERVGYMWIFVATLVSVIAFVLYKFWYRLASLW